jgi:hypothetical protein
MPEVTRRRLLAARAGAAPVPAGWNGSNVAVTNAAHNGSLAAGGATFGFTATVTGTNQPPAAITRTTT